MSHPASPHDPIRPDETLITAEHHWQDDPSIMGG